LGYTPDIILQTVVRGLLIGFSYSLLAMGLSLIFGVVDIVNFAHGEFLMIGMYVAFWCNELLRIDPIYAVPICAAAIALLGVGTHKLLIRRVLRAPPSIQMFSTFGLFVFLRAMAQFLWTGDFRFIQDSVVKGRLEIFGIFVGTPQLVAAGVAVVTCGLVYWFIERTDLGRALQAVSEDREAASLMGINCERMYTLAWALAGATVGLAGATLSTYQYIFPEVGGIYLTICFVVVALSGFGSVAGALLGGVIVGMVEVLAGLFISPAFKYAIVFVLFLGIILIRPRGLLGKE
jgi:branched-chain amino acid transport system permease protein